MLGYDDLGSSLVRLHLLRIDISPFAQMVKATPVCNLKAVVPTDEEKEKAIAKRAHMDEKKKKSVKASIRNFWKSNVNANMGACSEVPHRQVDRSPLAMRKHREGGAEQ